jgi:hypothetical protein
VRRGVPVLLAASPGAKGWPVANCRTQLALPPHEGFDRGLRSSVFEDRPRQSCCAVEACGQPIDGLLKIARATK